MKMLDQHQQKREVGKKAKNLESCPSYPPTASQKNLT